MAGKKGMMPSVSDLLKQSKRRKTALTSIKEACTILRSAVDSLEDCHLSELDMSEKAILAVARHGLSAVVKGTKLMRCMPPTLGKQRSTIIASDCNISIDEVSSLVNLLQDDCWCDGFCDTDTTVVLTPPTVQCFDCERTLITNHVTKVRCYTCTGASFATKITLRCKRCSISYNYSQFGKKSENGFRYYPIMQEYVEASDTVFVHRQLLEMQCCLANHSWVSFQGFCESYNDAFNLPHDLEFTPRVVADAFYTGELEAELRLVGHVDYLFKKDSDRELCMEMIEGIRRTSTYPHPTVECTPDCKERGCGSLWVTDGIWKTVFPHCMFRVEQSVQNLKLNLPDVCVATPLKGKAFCREHCSLLSQEAPDVPLDLHDFISYCQTKGGVNDECDDLVDDVIDSLAVPGNTVGESPLESQGISELLEKNPEIVSTTDFEDVNEPLCRKDTGKGKRLRKWSRGHQFIVRAGGHIDTWQPIYKSESPSQVFLLLLQWLLSMVNPLNPNSKPNVTLAYDNICNLDRMKVAKHPLPLPKPLDTIWIDVTKIIDVFHFPNHVSEECKNKYSPEKVKNENPSFNTQAGEQTFVWVGRFKHILCSMNKTHHLFYLHRMVRRRNAYTVKCYRNGRKPVLPKKD